MLATAKRITKRAIDRGLGRFGWRLTRTTTSPSVLDLRGETDDPIAAIYLARKRPFVIDVPLARCRGMSLLAFDLGPNTAHPRVRTLQAYSKGHCTQFEGSPLERYYDYFQPRSSAAFLGLDGASPFSELPPMAATPPWSTRDPAQHLQYKLDIAERENRQVGMALTADLGSRVFGPVTREMGANEMTRLTRIHASIQQKGFLRHEGPEGDIAATILVAGKTWACLIQRGHHRIAALAALGEDRAPIRLMDHDSNLIVRREDVDQWPQVRSGLYTSGQALALFDRILDGRPPHGAVPPEWEK